MLHKTHYLLATLLWITPIHELGHVIICHITGSKIIAINWWHSVRYLPIAGDPYNWLQDGWEYSTILPYIFIFLFTEYNIYRWYRDKKRSS